MQFLKNLVSKIKQKEKKVFWNHHNVSISLEKISQFSFILYDQ